MACFHPIEAVQEGGGRLKVGNGTHDRVQGRPLWLPCQKCIGCKQVRARDWALRLQHEAQLHKHKQFITLTYNDEHYSPTLIPDDTTKFIHKLRAQIHRDNIDRTKNKNTERQKIKYYIAGEYGEQNDRPHYHMILFGYEFTDLVKQDKTLYKSAKLEKIWGQGYCSVGEVNAQTCAYVTKYVTKIVNEGNVEKHYNVLDPRTGEIIQRHKEFARMSLKPAIGKRWIEKYWPEVYQSRDGITKPGGTTMPPPKYYDKYLKDKHNDLYEYKQKERYERSAKWTQDNAPDRLAARETCALARQKLRKTKL